MPPIDRLAAFALTAFVVIVVPGPSVLFVVARAMADGRRVAVLSVVGNAAGEYVQVVAVAFGVGALAERSVLAFDVIKALGGLYLVYLGVRTFRDRRQLAASLAAPPTARSDRRSLAQGFLVGATNPKTVVFLAAILPQFADRAAGPVADQVLVLGAVFAAVALVSDSAWALTAGRLRGWALRSPQRLERVGGVSGLTIIALGAGVLLTGRRD